MKKLVCMAGRSRPFFAAALLFAGVATHAAAPTGRFTWTADVVTDTITGLVWQRRMPLTGLSWSSAQTYCPSLSLGGWSTGWRLPTLKELQTIVDVRSVNSAIDASAFGGAPWCFWSSSLRTANTGYAWTVDYYHGRTQYVDVNSLNCLARCVR